jgi:predicted acetyltransferase
MNLDVRTLEEDDLPAFVSALNLGFNRRVQDGEIELRRSGMSLDRTHAAFVRGPDAPSGGNAASKAASRVVGTARSFPTPLTVPGGRSVIAGAVTNVTVAPTFRRRGVLRAMMTAQLEDVASREEPVAILIASEAPIYGRYGYGTATLHAHYRLETATARFAARPAAADQVRTLDHDELRVVGPGIYERFRVSQPGAIGRDDRWWDFYTSILRRPGDDSADKRLHAACGDDGWASYSIEDKWEHGVSATRLEVADLVAVTADAYAALWHHLLTLDLVATVEAGDRPPIEPLPQLLTDSRRAFQTEVADFLWVRLLDLPTALAARTYSNPDRLVIDVVDKFRPGSSGRFAVEGGPEGGACAATDKEPDLVLTVGDLGAAYLGGTPLYPAAYIGRVDERTTGAVRRFDAMFLSTPIPWCNTWF